MPSIRDENTINALAREYVSNGYNKEQALITVGYTASYARSGLGYRVYANVRLKDVISRLETEKVVKDEDRRQVLSKRLDHTYAKADTKADCASMVAACRADAKLRGLETDVGRTEGDQQRELTEHQAEMGRKLAKLAIEQELAELRKGSIKATEVA